METNRILIVDDEPDIAKVLMLHLEDAGFECDWADCGAKAAEMLAGEDYSLVLLDVRMPGVSGVELLCRIKGEQPDLPVIMMTAYGGESMAVECMKIGASDYLPKPFPLDDALDRIRRVLSLHRSQREKKRLQSVVMEQGYRLAAILDSLGDMLLILDADGIVTSVSRSMAELIGGVPGKIIGSHITESLPPHICSTPISSLEVIKTGKPYKEQEITLMLENGPVTVLSHAAPLHDSSGRFSGCVEVLHDITHRKQLEQQKEDFLSMLSHDLRNPITSISGSIELMKDRKLGPINSEQEEFLAAALDSCGEIAELIENLLDIHRLELGKMPMKRESVDIGELLAQMQERFASSARFSDVRLMLEVAPGVPELWIDRLKLSRILGNLIGNAIKFTPEGGCVTIGGRAATGDDIASVPEGLPLKELPALLLHVRDTGEGIPEEDVGIIFDRFVQAKNRDPRGRGGTGLGLSFCRMMTEQFGGSIWVESTLGQGSCFYLLLPLKEKSE